MDLNTPISKSSKVYKMYAKRLAKLGIIKIEDFLYHKPSRYEDFSLISKIAQVQPGETVTIRGVVEEIKNEYTRRYKKIQKAKVKDDSGTIGVIWFNQPFLTKSIHKGDKISLSGKAEKNSNELILQSPQFEIIIDDLPTIHTGGLIPVYPETKGVSSKWLRRQVFKILKENGNEIKEFLPEKTIRKYNFPKLLNSFEKIHFPENLESAEKAKERLSFEEFLIMQLAGLTRRSEWTNQVKGITFEIEKHKEKVEKFINHLPFELTKAQERSVLEITKDLSSQKAMNRLLEGDVGSGKTVVAAVAIYLAYLNGFQSILMAPTEILANQHYQTINKLLSPFKLKIALLTGSKKISIDNYDVLVGTHAVLSSKITLEKLGLVIVDEQQRFGVEQRALIRKKGKNPHFLTMTATPIPRTVALTMYGDLDVSYLDEMPKGRKQVKTWLVPPSKREGAYSWIKNQVKNEKSQAFIVCPFIEESETMVTVKAATKEFENLQKNVFPDLKLGLLHGKMKSKEKDEALNNFKEGVFDILVATPVVEVGIDIPNATVIMIEASDRFGLSQLHQLRGRVGRGDKQSYCLLFTQSKTEKTIERLKAMETIYFGPELAEIDLKLRGPGQIYGTMQHGIPKLKIASFSDFDLISKAKDEAENIYGEIDKYPLLFKKVKSENNKEISRD